MKNYSEFLDFYGRSFLNVLLFFILFFSTVCCSSTLAQKLKVPIQLPGKVVVPDAQANQVYVRSKNSGALRTDSVGNFKYEVRAFPDTLRFSRSDLFPVIRILRSESDVSEPLVVRMIQQVKQLDQVEISTGYQKVKPNETNGTVSVIDSRMLNARTGTNILDRLLGQSSGLLLNTGKSNANPQNKTGISIRGLGTINGPLDPLIVLDGFIYEGDINNINPFDIESVSILKDASATSIWGARAGNGVIVLSSKKARLNQSLNISFSANATVRSMVDLKSLKQGATTDVLDVERFLFDKGYFDARISNGYASLSPAVELFLAQRNGKISAAQLETGLDVLRSTDIQQDWQKEFYTNALTQQYAVNLRLGTSKNTQSVTAGFDRGYDESYAGSKKYNLRYAQETLLTPRLSFSTSISLTFATGSSGRPTYGSLLIAGRQGYAPLRDAAGNPLSWAREFRSAYTDTAGAGKLQDWNYYPTEEYKHAITSFDRQEILGSASMRYKVLDFLNVEASYQRQKQNLSILNNSDGESFASRNLVNSFSQFNRTTGVMKYIVPKGGSLRTDRQEVTSSTARLQVNLDKNIGVSSIGFLAGAEVREAQSIGSGDILYGYLNDPLVYQMVDFAGSYPNFITGNALAIPGGSGLSSTQNRFISFYGNGSYTYRGKYRISSSIRRDGSNVFGANTNDKWKPLWSVGLGWSLSQESFYNITWLPQLRLSLTYGKSGNVDLSKTAYATGTMGSNSASTLPFVRISRINNPDLRWEQLSQVNLKVDFSLKNDRLMGSIALYRKHGSDLYGSYLYDYTTWGASAELTRNVADMEGKGVDAELHSRNILGSSFKWSTDLYFSMNKSKTVKYYSTNNSLSALLGGGNTITPVVGLPLYSISGYKWGGLDGAGNPRGYLKGNLSTDYSAIAAEGRLSAANIEYIGPASPTCFGSLINSFSYHNFTLAFNISYRLGYFVKKRSFSSSDITGSGVLHPDYYLRWQRPGDEANTTVPSFLYPLNSLRDNFYSNASVNVIPADNIRIDYVNIGYHISAEKWRIPFRTLDLFFNAANVGLLWKANNFGLDPDYMDQIPQTKGYTIGIRGSF
ncbi:SusC/RagA family TonB-linked outer membrane protein [Pedobacter heparinus]|uniref:TonB-dependent receptor plug n=1 Tax=Pedobacter heparinus (strain ATCC 13125 / DSM 2366 / CIP 104194 / JCM 7457 / NBRC 12017 / NCIMB 9290 / NRRL B-14731 / HIM 762-3) TaxID=485917 RepID=C6XYS4_PEDHD|nr:SusC/RagA family TonB-linked outer membrane protein [Pedobacter heparinus]ACU04556.1 TonB-dependent receptor plug [Pedobacter heparinus DSM 2366]